MWKITPSSALAAWAVGTAWLFAFYILDDFDPTPNKFDLVDWIQSAVAVVALFCYPLFRKGFATWLDTQSPEK